MTTQVETEFCHEYIKSGIRCSNKAKITRIDCKRVCGIHKNIKKEPPEVCQPVRNKQPKIKAELDFEFTKSDIQSLKASGIFADSSEDSDDEF